MTRLADVVERLGGSLQSGGTRALVPGPGHSKSDRSLSLVQSGCRIIYHSFAGDSDESIRDHLQLTDVRSASVEERRQAKLDRVSIQRAADLRAWAFCRDVWGRTQPVQGTPAETYLRGRGVVASPDDVRFHAAAPTSYRTTSTRPAMVVLLRRPSGAATAIQSTFIKPNGMGKAFPGASRLTFGPLRGGAVRLAQPRAGVLGIAEGTETALSFCQLFGIPTWAALGASNLSAFVPPPGLRELHIAADPGSIGQNAADRLVDRIGKNLPCTLHTPAIGAGDWNDVLMGSMEGSR